MRACGNIRDLTLRGRVHRGSHGGRGRRNCRDARWITGGGDLGSSGGSGALTRRLQGDQPSGNTLSVGLGVKMSTTHLHTPLASFFQTVTPLPYCVCTLPVESAIVTRLCSTR